MRSSGPIGQTVRLFRTACDHQYRASGLHRNAIVGNPHPKAIFDRLRVPWTWGVPNGEEAKGPL